MATLTKEQIKAKKQQKEAGACELPDDALDQAAGGAPFPQCIAHGMDKTTPIAPL